MSEFEVRHEVSGNKGRYFIRHPDGESELTYSIMSPTMVIADHTAVAPGHEGQGVGLVMLKRFLADAETEGFRIVPLCPFVNAQRKRHPEWAALFAV